MNGVSEAVLGVAEKAKMMNNFLKKKVEEYAELKIWNWIVKKNPGNQELPNPQNRAKKFWALLPEKIKSNENWKH